MRSRMVQLSLGLIRTPSSVYGRFVGREGFSGEPDGTASSGFLDNVDMSAPVN